MITAFGSAGNCGCSVRSRTLLPITVDQSYSQALDPNSHAVAELIENCTESIAMSPVQLMPSVPLKRTWFVPMGKFTATCVHGALSLVCWLPLRLQPVAAHVPLTRASTDRLPMLAPYM